MGRCCFYTAGTLSLLLLVTSVTLLVARVFQKAVDQTIEKVRQARGVCMCVCVRARVSFQAILLLRLCVGRVALAPTLQNTTLVCPLCPGLGRVGRLEVTVTFK